MTDRLPRLVRPLYDQYIYIAEVLMTNDIYQMTKRHFIGLVMKNAHGKANPTTVSKIYDDLMEEAGLPPLEEEYNVDAVINNLQWAEKHYPEAFDKMLADMFGHGEKK